VWNGDIKTEISSDQYKLVTHQGKSGDKYQFDVFYPFDGFRDLELFDTQALITQTTMKMKKSHYKNARWQMSYFLCLILTEARCWR